MGENIYYWQNKCNIRQFKSWRHRWRYMYWFYKIRKKTSFRLLYFIPPQKIGHVILSYMYNEKANRLYIKNISDYITTPDTKYLYSIDDNHLIWIENTPSYEKIPNEVCRLQIYNHPSLSVERELKEEYLKE